MANGDQTNGDYVWKSGFKTGTVVGQIIADNATIRVTSGGTVYEWKVKIMNRGSEPGDSGGPVYWGGAAFGIISSTDEAQTITVYDTAQRVQNKLDVSLCTSDAC